MTLNYSLISETSFKNQVKKDLATLDRCYFFKTQERTRRGVLDIIICLKGRFIAIELKRELAEPTPLQSVIITEIQRAGGMAFSTKPSQWNTHFEMLKNV